METRRGQKRAATEAHAGNGTGIPGVGGKGNGPMEVRGLAAQTGVLKAGLESEPAQLHQRAHQRRGRATGLRGTLAAMPGEITSEHVAAAIWMPVAILLLVVALLVA